MIIKILYLGKGQKLWQPHLLHQPNKILGFDNIFLYLGKGEEKLWQPHLLHKQIIFFGALTIFYTRMGHGEYALNRR